MILQIYGYSDGTVVTLQDWSDKLSRYGPPRLQLPACSSGANLNRRRSCLRSAGILRFSLSYRDVEELLAERERDPCLSRALATRSGTHDVECVDDRRVLKGGIVKPQAGVASRLEFAHVGGLAREPNTRTSCTNEKRRNVLQRNINIFVAQSG